MEQERNYSIEKGVERSCVWGAGTGNVGWGGVRDSSFCIIVLVVLIV